MTINKQKGLCGYCLGAKQLAVPDNNDPKEAELNNFHLENCPVCYGTGESLTLMDVEDDEELPIEEDLFLDLEDFSEFIPDEEDEEDDNGSNDINNQS